MRARVRLHRVSLGWHCCAANAASNTKPCRVALSLSLSLYEDVCYVRLGFVRGVSICVSLGLDVLARRRPTETTPHRKVHTAINRMRARRCWFQKPKVATCGRAHSVPFRRQQQQRRHAATVLYARAHRSRLLEVCLEGACRCVLPLSQFRSAAVCGLQKVCAIPHFARPTIDRPSKRGGCGDKESQREREGILIIIRIIISRLRIARIPKPCDGVRKVTLCGI